MRYILKALIVAAAAVACMAVGKPPAAQDLRLAAIVDSVIRSEMKRTGAPGAAFIFVRRGRIVYQQGYGVSDLASGARVDPETTMWPIASITKVLTAVAALQLVERGRLELDEDVNLRLKRLQIPAQGYAPLTLRHLLSHTGGLDEIPGRRFDGRNPPDMAAAFKSKLVRYRAPGLRTAYSSYGMWLAGLMVEDASGEPYADYLRRHVFVPLGMSSARIVRRRGDEQGLATPYVLKDGKADRAEHEFYLSTPTSSMVATASDMGRLIKAMLPRPTGGSVLAPAMLARMESQQATVHPDLPGWGLGLQMDRVNGRRIAEHGGDIGGFSALLVLLPDEDAGFFIVSHGEGSDLRFAVKQALMDALYPGPPAGLAPNPKQPSMSELRGYAGRYVSSMACHTCPGAAEDAFALTVNDDNSLSLWGQRWRMVRRDLFVRDDGKRSIGFARDGAGRIVAVSGGSWRVADRLPD